MDKKVMSGSRTSEMDPLGYTFECPSDIFSKPLFIHHDYYVQFMTKRKSAPDSEIAGKRCSYKQLRLFTSDPTIEDPAEETMWDGRTLGQFCISTLFEEIKEKQAKEAEAEAEAKAAGAPVTSKRVVAKKREPKRRRLT